jgi:hypothetical protein
VKQHPKSLYEALFSLQHIKKPGRVGSPFDNLTISTLKGWFEKDVTGRFVLRRKYEEAIKLQSARSAAQDKGPRGILKDHLVAFQMIVNTLKGMRDSGQPLDNTIAQTVIQGIISAVAPELFERGTKSGFFSVSRRFTRKFCSALFALVDGFLGGAGRAQAVDQEGVDEVRDGEDSRSGVPSKGLVKMSDKGSAGTRSSGGGYNGRA